jgi:hypothetical protein
MEQFLKDNFKLLLFLAVVSNAAVILASILYRAWKGKTHLAIPAFDLKFSEKWVSGSSHKNILTKIGGASNCLVVELSKNALIIRPMFPFNLAFLPQAYFLDLEHFIPTSKIKSVQPDGTGDKGRVIVEFEAAGGDKRIELLLRKRQDFLRAVGTWFAHQPVPSGILT